MKRFRLTRNLIGGCAGAVALTLAFSTLCAAQAVTPTLITVTQVKPEMLTEWIDLQKNEVIPALKKAGVKSREVRVGVLGENYEYLSISPAPKAATVDGPGVLTSALGAEAAGRLTAKLRKCIVSQRTYLTNGVTDLSLPADPKTPPVASVTTRYRTNVGKGQDYENYVKADLLPVYKKAKAEGKIAGYTFTRRGRGANPLDRTQTFYYNKFADMDAGPALNVMLGAEAADKLRAKAAGMATIVEQVVRRRVAELSF